MKLLAKRTMLSVAAAGLFAFGLAGCGGSADNAGNDNTSGSGSSPAEEKKPGVLTCKDLEKQTDKTGLTEGLTFDDLPQDKLDTMYAWMAEHGAEFKDVALGESVTAVGENGPDYDAVQNPPQDVFDAYVEGSTAIDTACPGIGFGFEE
ncbi:hypothetical protein [Phytomonospora endophytica]|uniref:Lipoprotein n=1 Tax=Phytomonospora endophytica TaxID=714109 RepID=A0A841FV64_9ACTN|nr:hypothetical protein [Phytomonospora endophytica]MBB6039896.1 hypothetical protein [Phytomonospora endophytica]GIG71034.1 hypothetical protein Pen01_73290 [Phytomonospora endophytica]